MIRFIDVSTAQGSIDWRAVKASGVDATWIKASEGSSANAKRQSYFLENALAARAAGLWVGAYHFCRLGDVDKEVKAYLRAVGDTWLDMPMWLDLEPSEGAFDLWSFDGGLRHSLADLLQYAGEWKSKIPNSCLYSYRSMLSKSKKWGMPLVIATRPWGDHKAPPADPMPKAPAMPWAGWQYASKMGRCPGVDGPVDLGLWRGV